MERKYRFESRALNSSEEKQSTWLLVSRLSMRSSIFILFTLQYVCGNNLFSIVRPRVLTKVCTAANLRVIYYTNLITKISKSSYHMILHLQSIDTQASDCGIEIWAQLLQQAGLSFHLSNVMPTISNLVHGGGDAFLQYHKLVHIHMQHY